MPPIQLDKGTLSVTLLGGILAVAIYGTWWFTSWSTRVEVRLETLQKNVDEALSDRWQGDDMVRWAELLREANPNIKVPAPRTN